MGKYIFIFIIGLMFLSTETTYGMPQLEDGGPGKQLRPGGKVLHTAKKKASKPKKPNTTVIVKEIHHETVKTPCSYTGAVIATAAGIGVGGLTGFATTGGPGVVPGVVVGGIGGLAAYDARCIINGGYE